MLKVECVYCGPGPDLRDHRERLAILRRILEGRLAVTEAQVVAAADRVAVAESAHRQAIEDMSAAKLVLSHLNVAIVGITE